jgi:hypothetical protein
MSKILAQEKKQHFFAHANLSTLMGLILCRSTLHLTSVMIFIYSDLSFDIHLSPLLAVPSNK